MNGTANLELAMRHLNFFCNVRPNRRTGSLGNREATRYFANLVESFGFDVDNTTFPCLDHEVGAANLSSENESFEINISPYSRGCSRETTLVSASSIVELEKIECEGKLLLLQGDITSEQLMPKKFPFYNPDHHRKIYEVLELKKPAAIITATTKNPESAGALYPYPMINDGDFHIPSAFCTEKVGRDIFRRRDECFRIAIDANRVPAEANNVIARLNPRADRKITLTAHIDAYEDSPGALDNASGTVTLLLIAMMLQNHGGAIGIEIAALNGEDHYSAAGQIDYLARYGHDLKETLIAINIDSIGYKEGRSLYSQYGCPPDLREASDQIFRNYPGISKGNPWHNGDHMIFVQNHVSAIAFSAELVPELTTTITHTLKDIPELVDPKKLVEVARALVAFVKRLEET